MKYRSQVESKDDTMDYNKYFEYRKVSPEKYSATDIPAYLKRVIGDDKDINILDFGCGFGQISYALKKNGYENVEGLDIAPEAITYCRSKGLKCHDGREKTFMSDHAGIYDFVILSHVIEHFPKEEIIPLLRNINSILKPNGAVVVMVPNAQSNTGCYWAYEDFTHYTLFTAGSLYYVLTSAGYSSVEYLDPQCLEGMPPTKALIKRFLLWLYKMNYLFWNRVTGSSFHNESPIIFSFDIRALAKK